MHTAQPETGLPSQLALSWGCAEEEDHQALESNHAAVFCLTRLLPQTHCWGWNVARPSCFWGRVIVVLFPLEYTGDQRTIWWRPADGNGCLDGGVCKQCVCVQAADLPHCGVCRQMQSPTLGRAGSGCAQ